MRARTGFADAAGPGEEVGVGDALALDGVLEDLGDRFLADEIAELLRTIAAGQDGVLGGGGFRLGGVGTARLWVLRLAMVIVIHRPTVVAR